LGDAFIALERGEVEFVVPTEATLSAFHQPKLESGELVPVFAIAGKRLESYPNVPTLREFGKTDVEKAFLKIFTVPADIGRSLAAPPGLPKDRLDALRTAFDRMIADPEFKAEAAKARVDIDPMSGAALHRLVLESMKMPPETREQARGFYDDLFKK
jgi:tripartite-type tricarboxylate transporter receptor subunit TctC